MVGVLKNAPQNPFPICVGTYALVEGVDETSDIQRKLMVFSFL